MTARAAQLRAAGRDVISLSVGEPDFATPPHIAEAAHAAIRAGATRYTDVGGIEALKDAIRGKFERDNGLHFARDQVMVSTGAKQTLFNLCLAVLDAGDEVIVPAPCWVSYPDMVRLADATPVVLPTTAATRFKLQATQLAAAITPRTRLLMLNSPSNPTGSAYTRSELAALAAVLQQHPRVLVCTDDIYEHIYWGTEPFCSLLTAAPFLAERTITVNGCSKAYAMTGWRIGYCGAPADLVAAMTKLQGQSTTSANTVAQHAAVAALNGPQDCVVEMNAAFRARHDWVVPRLNAIPGFECRRTDGTFYAWVDTSAAIRRSGLRDDEHLAEHLLERAGVATVPGSGFLAPGHLRLSFATSPHLLEQALDRIEATLR